MYWLIPALLTAFFVATQDAWIKRFFADLDHWAMASYPMVYSLPWLLAALPWVTVPPLDATFVWTFLVALPLNGVCFVLYYRAIRIAPLSLTLPYLAFTPVFLLVTGLLFLGEQVNGAGGAGVLLTVAGCYVLNCEPGRLEFLAPIRALTRERGSLLMLLVAFLFSFAAVLGKMSIVHSSPLFFVVSFFFCQNMLVPLFLLLTGRLQWKTLILRPKQGFAAGGLYFAHLLCHSLALVMTKAVYMIAIKRTSVLIGMVYAHCWFREQHLAIRFLGAALMISGSAVILLFGR